MTSRRGGETGRPPTRLRIEVPARLDAITPAVRQVMSVVRGAGWPAGKEFEIETAVREALANAVYHGSAGDASKRVCVRVSRNERTGVVVVVRDGGPGFDPAQVPSPVVGRNVLRHEGRGLYLIRQLMDEVSFAKGGSEIRMRKR